MDWHVQGLIWEAACMTCMPADDAFWHHSVIRAVDRRPDSRIRLHCRYSCTSILQLVDKSMVKVCETDEERNGRFDARKYLTKQDAPTLYRLAHDLHLNSFESTSGSSWESLPLTSI